MNGLRLVTLEEQDALAVLADAVERCRTRAQTPDDTSCWWGGCGAY